ncbi:MAG: hypothetical protein AABX17_00660 [Nanoarchaeota archaeon]
MTRQLAEHLRDFKESIWGKRNSFHCSERETREYLILDLENDILEDDVLSAKIDTPAEVKTLAEYLDKKDKKIPSRRRFFSFASELGSEFNSIFRTYGVSINENNNFDLAVRVYMDCEDDTGQLRVLSDNPSKEEVIGRTLTKFKRQEPLLKYGSLPPGVLPGFDNWKAALAFDGYSHLCMIRKKIGSLTIYTPAGRYIVRKKNHRRYLSFGFTSEEAVREIKPGALYAVENKFGKDIGSKVNGNLDYFRELLFEVNRKKG